MSDPTAPSPGLPPQAVAPAYRVETARTVLRCWRPADAPLLANAVTASVEHLRPWMPWVESEPEELAVKVARLRTFRAHFDLDQEYIYGIFDPAEERVLGGTGLHGGLGDGVLEIGYWIHADQVNQGLATEVSAALTKVAFEINRVHRVEIHCDPSNTQSAAVPRKLGFIHETTRRSYLQLADGTYRDTMIWTMLAPEYSERLPATATITAYDSCGRRFA